MSPYVVTDWSQTTTHPGSYLNSLRCHGVGLLGRRHRRFSNLPVKTETDAQPKYSTPIIGDWFVLDQELLEIGSYSTKISNSWAGVVFDLARNSIVLDARRGQPRFILDLASRGSYSTPIFGDWFVLDQELLGIV